MPGINHPDQPRMPSGVLGTWCHKEARTGFWREHGFPRRGVAAGAARMAVGGARGAQGPSRRGRWCGTTGLACGGGAVTARAAASGCHRRLDRAVPRQDRKRAAEQLDDGWWWTHVRLVGEAVIHVKGGARPSMIRAECEGRLRRIAGVLPPKPVPGRWPCDVPPPPKRGPPKSRRSGGDQCLDETVPLDVVPAQREDFLELIDNRPEVLSGAGGDLPHDSAQVLRVLPQLRIQPAR